MLRLFSSIECTPQGLTRIAYGDGIGYLIHTDYDPESDTFELKLLVENAKSPGSIEMLGKSIHADDLPELTFLVETFICALEELGPERSSFDDIAAAWDETASLKQGQ